MADYTGYDDAKVTLGDGCLNVESAMFGVEKVSGSRSFVRDPRLSAIADKLPQLWVAPNQMAQLAPGTKWCKTCGNVRPNSYFDVLAWDERGLATRWDTRNQPIAWDGIRFAVKWMDECRQCINMRDPKLRQQKYCSGCKQEKRRDEFGADLRNSDELQTRCRECEAKRLRELYKVKVGREVKQYASRQAG